MNSIERKLIELNQALLKLAAGEKPSEELITSAQKALAGGMSFNTGPGDDVVIINKNSCEPEPGVQGTQGVQGAQGIQGPAGPTVGGSCDKILVSSDYTASCNNFYIGVNSDGPVTITLPECEEGCCEIVIKAEMGPPLGNRKITVVPSGNTTIDDGDKYVMEVPYEVLRIICNNGKWYTI